MAKTARQRRAKLVGDLEDKRKSFAGLGTRKAKLRLNKLAKTNPVAKALRQALELGDVNIQAKKYFGKWRTKYYDKKADLIDELVKTFIENGWKSYGIQVSNIPGPTYVIYFDIPGCEQISFHFTPKPGKTYPKYLKQWDKKEFSTLDKLEVAVKQVLDAGERVSKSPVSNLAVSEDAA